MSTLHGVLSAVSTPFTADGEAVDEPALRELIERTISGGVHGLVPCGSTGEFGGMTADERRRVAEIVIDQAGGRLPVVPHTGAMTTREAISLSRHAEQSGAAAVLVVAPYYEPLEVEETKDYFRAVAGALSIPVVVYNLPVATGVNLQPSDIVELATDVPNIRYVKDTTGDLSQAARLIHDHGDQVGTFVGWDTLFFAATVEGAAGSIVGAANIVAPQLVQVYDAVQEGRLGDAKQVWNTIFPLMQYLVSGPYVAGVKGALEIQGHSAGPARAPLAHIAGDREKQLQEILDELSLSV